MRNYYAFTNEFNGRSYKNYHIFDNKKNRDQFVVENANAFSITAKEFKNDVAYINKYSDVCNFCSEIIEH